IHTMSTFNMNGAVEETKTLVTTDKIKKRSFVGKNVCHTVEFTKERLERFSPTKCRASELFLEAANMYFNKHNSKKFHDPVAAVCHLHPEIGGWVKGKPYRESGKWGTQLDNQGCNVLACLDEERFWEIIGGWK